MIWILLLAMISLFGFSEKTPVPSDKKATQETINLFQSLYKLQNKGVMYGHQDDLMYGNMWWYEKDRSDTKDFTGGYPAIAGFELGHLELGNERSLDSVSFAHITEQIKVHYKRGGIITISFLSICMTGVSSLEENWIVHSALFSPKLLKETNLQH